MIINRVSNCQWQLILVSKLDPAQLMKTGALLLLLNHQVPNVHPSDAYIMDFSHENIDILGTCGLPTNAKLVASLKYNCITILNGNTQPNYWTKLLNNVVETKSLHFYAYVKFISLSTTKRIFINAFIANKRSTEYDKAVMHAKVQEPFLQKYKRVIFWVSF